MREDFAAIQNLPSDRFLAMRHGYGDHNLYKDQHGTHPEICDPELHAYGEQQAIESADYCRQKNIIVRHVICAPLVRALKTAEVFLKRSGWQGTVVVDPLVSEFLHPVAKVNIGSPRDMLLPRFNKDSAQTRIHFDFSGMVDGQWWPQDWETEANLETRVQATLQKYFHDFKTAASVHVDCRSWPVDFAIE